MAFHIIRFTILQSAPFLLLVLLSANVVLAMPIAQNIGKSMQNISSRSVAVLPPVRTLSQDSVNALQDTPTSIHTIEWQREMARSHASLMFTVAIYRDLMHIMDSNRDPPELWLRVYSTFFDPGTSPKAFWSSIATSCSGFLERQDRFPHSTRLRDRWKSLSRNFQAKARENHALPNADGITDRIDFNFLPENLSARALNHRTEYWGMIMTVMRIRLERYAGMYAYSINAFHNQMVLLPTHLSTQQYWDENIKEWNQFLKEYIDEHSMRGAHQLVTNKIREAEDAKDRGDEPPGVLTYPSNLHVMFRNDPKVAASLYNVYTR